MVWRGQRKCKGGARAEGGLLLLGFNFQKMSLQETVVSYCNYDLPRCVGRSKTFHCASEAEVRATLERNKADIQEAHLHENFKLVIYYKSQ